MMADMPKQEPHVFWPRTSEYINRVKSFPIGESDGLARLVKRLVQNDDQRVKRLALVLLIGDEYLFAVPEKTKTSLTGFYLNAITGGIEYKITDHPSLDYGEAPKGSIVYSSVEKIQP